jgi:hypothetical protein
MFEWALRKASFENVTIKIMMEVRIEHKKANQDD